MAAENDVIPGAKVGGIGDVIRDIPTALASSGATVTVVIPAYGQFHKLTGAQWLKSCEVAFGARSVTVQLYEIYAGRDPGVRYILLEHSLFSICGAGHVYCDDGQDQPFATDANKFALFSAAGLVAIRNGLFGVVDVLHLHDWHTGFAAILREFDPEFEALKSIHCVFSIHNLALQGIRPLSGHNSSLATWFPNLRYRNDAICDPRWSNCVNPMAAGIRLADKVHTVSPTYADEILHPNVHETGFHGGEGLERDLLQVQAEHKLTGILNGIDYHDKSDFSLCWRSLLTALGNTVLSWLGNVKTICPVDYLAHQRIQSWLSGSRPQHVLTSVSRLTDQKMAILFNRTANEGTTLDQLLTTLGNKGVFILLGSGDAELEARCQQCAANHTNFLFLNRYSVEISNYLFANGDLFVMPSSFEPCGISQMLAMRYGQPCLVHAVGGLADTVRDGEDGFHFHGQSLSDQSIQLLEKLKSVLELRVQQPEIYRTIARAARQRRFLWSDSAQRYLTELYS